MLERIGLTSGWRVVLLGLGVLIVLAAALSPATADPLIRAWAFVAGFLLMAVALIGASRVTVIPLILAVILSVFCGFSAVVAVPEPLETAIERAKVLPEDQVEASVPAEGMANVGDDESFDYAARVTGLGGLAMMLAALAVAAMTASEQPRRRRLDARIERAGKVMVILGFLGVIAALIRFVLTQFPVDDLFDSFKSFWIGGTYLLLLGTFAVPGFGLWVQGMIGRKAERREYLVPLITALIFVGLLAPTGQRGFAIALGVIFLAVLIGNRFVNLRQVVVIVLLGVFAIGLTQAVRNEASGTGKITVDGSLERVQPDQWRDLYASQIASFSWTMLIEENRDQLDIPNSFAQGLIKPVPRFVYPDKSQGFGYEFTSRVFPSAVKQNVSFATPLVAEADYNFGPVGAVLILALVGAAAMLADAFIARRSPRLVEPIVVATIFWTVFELVRGDLANAITFSSGWILPLLFFSMALGLRRDPPLRRILIDALQVAPNFSGIGRRVAELGESLKSDPVGLPIEVRCAREVESELRPCFPDGTRFRTPLARSRPRSLRILFQQLLAPLSTGPGTLLLCPGDQAPFWGRSPLLFVVHDVRRLAAPETAVAGLERTYYRRVMRAGARRARYLLTISEFSRQEIARHLEPGCPVALVSQQPEDVEPVPEERLRDNPPSFLLVGALRKYKGIDTAITALSRTGADRRPGAEPIRVICVGDTEGDPDYGEAVRRQCREAGVEDRFELLGWVSDERLAELQGEVAATLCPSTYEGYGLSVTEGLAAGLPALVSDIPPHRETAGDAGLYFEPGDADRLAQLLEEVGSDPERRVGLAWNSRDRHAELVAAERPWAVAIRSALTELP